MPFQDAIVKINFQTKSFLLMAIKICLVCLVTREQKPKDCWNDARIRFQLSEDYFVFNICVVFQQLI